MTIRRKLLTIFGALALVTLLVAGVSLFATGQWGRTTNQLDDHYRRSLLAQRVSLSAAQALNETQDAALGGDPEVREEFEAQVRSGKTDLASWRKLASTAAERAQVTAVEDAFVTLMQEARVAVGVGVAGNPAGAARRLEAMESGSLSRFEAVTQAAISSDREVRGAVRAAASDTRQTTRTVLLAASLAALSLALLLGAYLASDLFSPLRQLAGALDGAAAGQASALPENRADEIGEVHAAYNRLLQAQAARQHSAGSALETEDLSPLRVRTLVRELREQAGVAARAEPVGEHSLALAKVEALADRLSRVAAFGAPMRARLDRTDVRALVYDVLTRHADELAGRGVSLDLSLQPQVPPLLLDRDRVREALSELVGNALKNLPDAGGQLGLRARLSGDDLLLEVADNGPGVIPVGDPLAELGEGRRVGVGLALARLVAQAHGGDLSIDARPDVGARIVLRLPVPDRD